MKVSCEWSSGVVLQLFKICIVMCIHVHESFPHIPMAYMKCSMCVCQ